MSAVTSSHLLADGRTVPLDCLVTAAMMRKDR